jgi:PhnB protein
MVVKSIPDGFHTVTPYLVVEGAAKLIDFMKQAFGATSEEFMTNPDGTIMHAEAKIGDSVIMLGDAMGGEHQPLPGMIYLYVDDADATYQRALRAGAIPTMEIADQFWGHPYHGDCGPVLGGPRRGRKGPDGRSLVDRHSQRGRATRGDEKACRRVHEPASRALM